MRVMCLIATCFGRSQGSSISIFTLVYARFRSVYTLSGLGVRSARWSPNGQFIAIAYFNDSVHIYNTLTWRRVCALEHENNVLRTGVCMFMCACVCIIVGVCDRVCVIMCV